MNIDKKYLNLAIEESLKASNTDEVPVGAVIVIENKIIAKAHNEKESSKIATHHAEILAIERACKKQKSWRLSNATMYVTLEPCKMCMGAIEEARIDKVIYLVKTENTTPKVEVIYCDHNEMATRYLKILRDFFKNKRNR